MYITVGIIKISSVANVKNTINLKNVYPYSCSYKYILKNEEISIITVNIAKNKFIALV